MINDYIEKWIVKALNDLKIAGHELNQPADEMVTDAVCFHCQQAVEKIIKGLSCLKKYRFWKNS